jgi:VanZ family protein
VNPVVLPELRYRRSWFVLGLVIALAILVVCLLPTRRLPKLEVSDKFEHVLAFGALAFWFGSIVVRRDFGWLALLLIAFGAAIEVAQGLMDLGREADWRDLLADTIGITAGLLLALTPLGRWARWVERHLLGIGR